MPRERWLERDQPDQNAVHIEPWGEGDLVLLKQLLGDPAMTEHLGGPESDDELAERHTRYLRSDSPTEKLYEKACRLVSRQAGEK